MSPSEVLHLSLSMFKTSQADLSLKSDCAPRNTSARGA